MKLFIFIIISFYSLVTISQEKFSKEISLVTDNDLYASITRDRYYTSGIFLTYRYLSNNKNESLEKRIVEWEVVQKMYTPYVSIVDNILEHDRPFAGYLYTSFGINRVYKNEQILKTSVQIGVIGSNSYAEELQEFIHDIYGYRKAIGWEYQINNAFALNFNTTYLKTILKTKKNYFDITWTNNLNLGTVFTNISTGLNTRIGFKPLQKITNTIAHNTNLNNNKTLNSREIESFFYLKPMLRYAIYDATLQGSFLSKSNDVTKELIPLVFDVEVGLKFTYNRFNFGYAIIYNTSKSRGLRYTNGNRYGRIAIKYLLR